jgi:hypothetical protein
MNATDLKCVQESLRYITAPIDEFLQNGFYIEPEYQDKQITPVAIRRVIRAAAKEAKRPLIIVSNIRDIYGHDPVTNEYRRLPAGTGKWRGAWVRLPKRKYLIPLVTPFLLAAGGPNAGRGGVVECRERVGIWDFYVRDEALLIGFITAMQNDPDIRRALRLAPRLPNLER